jgi:AAA15 family ATPase/GTPase
MLRTFQIKGFRKFKDIKFDELSQINLFLGSNNVGKSTILEAFFAFITGKNINALLGNSILRRSNNVNGAYDFVERLLSIQHNQNVKPFTFAFSGTFESGKKYKFEHILEPYSIFSDIKPNLMGNFGNTQVEKNINNMKLVNNTGNIQITPVGKWKIRERNNHLTEVEIGFPPVSPDLQHDPLMLGRFVDILTHRETHENTKIYSSLKRENLMDEFIRELQNTFPNILGIDSIPYPDGSPSPVSFKTKNQLLPMYNFGDGVQRWYSILGGLLLYQNAIHCIEEIDATFHPSSQKDLSRNLYNYAKQYKNQLFMTSHSIEFVDNLLQAIYEENDYSEDIVRIITLKNDPDTNEVYSRTLTGREAYETREKYQLELR